MTITVDPVDPRPGDNITVDGSAPGCNLGTYEVTLTYTLPNGSTGTHVETGSFPIDDSSFSETFAIPANAVAGEPASVSAEAVCPPDGITRTSNTVALTIEAHEGAFTIAPDEVEAGDTVTASGTNCWGEFVVFYVEAGANPNDEDNIIDGADGTPTGDRTWSVEFETPEDLPAGDYDFYAACSGTDYETPQVLSVTSAAGPSPTPTPTATPPVPVPGGVDFTG